MEKHPKRTSVAQAVPARTVILLIDDDFWTRFSAAETLRALGYRVIEACDAAEGISVLTAGTQVDAVFSDINMPGDLDGLGFAAWLAEHHPRLPLLLTSGLARPALPQTSSSPSHFIAKPYDLLEVDRRLRLMLESV
jgi:two-component system, response regulator PdtaR